MNSIGWFGQVSWKWVNKGECMRCLMWRRRNRCFQMLDALCSVKSGQHKNILLNLNARKLIITMACGSIPEMDMEVQQRRIWMRVLCGDMSIAIGLEDSESDEDVEENWSWRILPDGTTPFIKLWMVDVMNPFTAKALIPRFNDEYRLCRIIFIVTAYLGKFSEFGVVAGHYWTRGWRYR